MHCDAHQRSIARIAAHCVDADARFLQLALCKQIRCSLKTCRSPEPGSLSCGFENRYSGHPLMVEGESRPKGAEHYGSSYIVIHGMAECIHDSARVALLLAEVAEGNADGERIVQKGVTLAVLSTRVDALHDPLIQRVEGSGVIESSRMRAQTDDTERRRCEQLEIGFFCRPLRNHRRHRTVLANARGESVGPEMADHHPELERAHAPAEGGAVVHQ